MDPEKPLLSKLSQFPYYSVSLPDKHSNEKMFMVQTTLSEILLVETVTIGVSLFMEHICEKRDRR
jgi:hypothetical protein